MRDNQNAWGEIGDPSIFALAAWFISHGMMMQKATAASWTIGSSPLFASHNSSVNLKATVRQAYGTIEWLMETI